MRSHAGYELDDSPERLDLDVIWGFLSTQAYWARWRTRADVEGQIARAWRIVAAYAPSGEQVAFARAWSDGVTSVYLGDVFVLPAHRGHGLGVAVVEEMVERGPGAGLRWLLHTADAHTLYARFGFAPPDRTFLERPRPGRPDDPWEVDVAALWADAAALSEEDVVVRAETLAARRPGHTDADFELASAYDFVGRAADAEVHYLAALTPASEASPLDDARRAQARIQLASTLRTLGRADEALELLAEPLGHRWDDARAAFAALALLDAGRDREAAMVALRSLAGRLPVYRRAVTAYVDELTDAPPRPKDS